MEYYDLGSDELLAMVVPIVAYWVYSGIYMMLGDYVDRYRLHSKKDEDSKNLVTKSQVVRMVLLLQLCQAAIAFIVFKMDDTKNASKGNTSSSIITSARQIMVGMVVIDAWQYFWHRYMHLNKFLYRHIHSWHHRLVVPYAFGSMYNHPLEGILVDTLGGAIAYLVSGMSPRTSIFFFTFSIMKAIDDHCGLWLPGNYIFHNNFWSNSAYHNVHHQLSGNKYNFSQPFFVAWDKILGTHMPYVVEKRVSGGLQARPVAKKTGPQR